MVGWHTFARVLVCSRIPLQNGPRLLKPRPLLTPYMGEELMKDIEGNGRGHKAGACSRGSSIRRIRTGFRGFYVGQALRRGVGFSGLGFRIRPEIEAATTPRRQWPKHPGTLPRPET